MVTARIRPPAAPDNPAVTATQATPQVVTEQVAVSEAAPSTPSDVEQQAKEFIYLKESGNRTDAINPSSGACGLGQALPCSKLPCTLQDRMCQDNWFTGYMKGRYGTWNNAKQFWLNHQWW